MPWVKIFYKLNALIPSYHAIDLKIEVIYHHMTVSCKGPIVVEMNGANQIMTKDTC